MEVVTAVLVLGAALVPLVVPLFRPPPLALRSAGGPAARLRALELRKSAIYGAIREVGFDLRTDKVERGDYDRQIAVLKREAVEVVGEIEDLKTHPPRADKKSERAIAAVRKGNPAPHAAKSEVGASKRFCTQCGQEAADDARFCGKCGAALGTGE